MRQPGEVDGVEGVGVTGTGADDQVGFGGSGFRIDVEAYDSPAATALIAGVQQEYVRRYGGEDQAPVDPADFAPPRGLFLVAYLDGEPVGCGGWRVSGAASDGAAASCDAEIKRMYVAPEARRRGLARRLLERLEATAAAAGWRRMILETGLMQPEAIALYTSAGYDRVAPFGYYRGSAAARHYAKRLDPMRLAEADGSTGTERVTTDGRAG